MITSILVVFIYYQDIMQGYFPDISVLADKIINYYFGQSSRSKH